MEPAFYRGDLLFLTYNRDDPIRVGDIAVFKIDHREIPIVHRVLRVHETYVDKIKYFRENKTLKFLTKGDNNNVDDRGLYAEKQDWLTTKQVIGRAKGFFPYIGMYAVLGILGLVVLLRRES